MTDSSMRHAAFSCAAIFFGSFLLFLLQPMLGRTLLPVFGGSAAVWTVCLAAYQVLLLAGYAYAHRLAKLTPAKQRRIHLGVLCAATVWAGAFAALRPIVKTLFGDSPVPSLEVLFCVMVFAGLPYVALAAGSTLVQAWLASSPTSRNVFRLYAVSNLGSFAGLLAYPFVLEPFVSLSAQWWGVTAGLAVYAGLMMRTGRSSEPAGISPTVTTDDAGHADAMPAGKASTSYLWFLLPGVSAFLLNSVVAHLFSDVTPMPLVWVAMLAIFLLSYSIGFSHLASILRGVWYGAAVLSLLSAAWANGIWGARGFYPNTGASFFMLFFGGVVLHGWLYDVRPEAARLTRYYLAIAVGGAVGGLLSALVAPVVFNQVSEYPLALCVCAFLVARRILPLKRKWLGIIFATACAMAWLAFYAKMARTTTSKVLFSDRNFYGTVRVAQTFETFGTSQPMQVHYLWCGQTTHGMQIRSPHFRNIGISYYGNVGGGIAFSSHPKYLEGANVKVGVVGLGAGCLACYGRPGDLFRFYEINPLMIDVASKRELFTFLWDAPMPVDLVQGDARRMLEKERNAGDPLYDILVIDAYSGDAVPYHLATVEAFRLYFERLEEDGILAVHISNWHVDLLPLCKAAFTALGVHAYGVVSVAENPMTTGSVWVYMTRNPMMFRFKGREYMHEVKWEEVRDISVLSDEKGSLMPLLRARLH